MSDFTILDDGRPCRIDATRSGDRILFAPYDLSGALGWTLKPEGLCKDATCYPVAQTVDLLVDGSIDLEQFAATIDRPLALSREHDTAALGTAAAVRADGMDSLKAPDFALPDLDGRMHSLSEHLGKKVFLVAHASW